MQTMQLSAHPAFMPGTVRKVTAWCGVVGSWLQARWVVSPSSSLVLPAGTGPRRADELWTTTCFEIFAKPQGGEAYAEFNFAPSQSWAAYDFSAWRQGMADRPVSHHPVITHSKEGEDLVLEVALPLADLPHLPADLAMTCVIEEQGGAKSYWAAAHASAEKPDFHDPSCFAIALGPPHAL